MSDAIITVENLSKKYLVGHQSGSKSRSNYTALRDVIGREIRNVPHHRTDARAGDTSRPCMCGLPSPSLLT